MTQLKKHALCVDGQKVGEFYCAHVLSPHEASDIEAEYANAHFISSKGVHIYRVKNNKKLGELHVMPHYGKTT